MAQEATAREQPNSPMAHVRAWGHCAPSVAGAPSLRSTTVRVKWARKNGRAKNLARNPIPPSIPATKARCHDAASRSSSTASR